MNQYLAAGLLDELRLHVASVLLGAGERLFDGVGNVSFEPLAVTHRPRHTSELPRGPLSGASYLDVLLSALQPHAVRSNHNIPPAINGSGWPPKVIDREESILLKEAGEMRAGNERHL